MHRPVPGGSTHALAGAFLAARRRAAAALSLAMPVAFAALAPGAVAAAPPAPRADSLPDSVRLSYYLPAGVDYAPAVPTPRSVLGYSIHGDEASGANACSPSSSPAAISS
jgi:hypothetical protein